MSEQSGGAEGAREPDSRPGEPDSLPDTPEQAPAQDWSRPGGPGYPPPQPPAGWPQYPSQYPSPYPPQSHAPQSYPSQPYPPQPYPQPYPPAGMPPYPPYQQGGRRPAPPRAGTPPRIQPVAGTDFGLAYFTVPPVVAGQAIGSMVAGILSILVALVVSCFGLAGAQQGWGPIVAGAFAVLAAAAGLAGIGLGWFSVRQVTHSDGRLAGRGMAIAGISCGAAGLAITAVVMLLALLI